MSAIVFWRHVLTRVIYLFLPIFYVRQGLKTMSDIIASGCSNTDYSMTCLAFFFTPWLTGVKKLRRLLSPSLLRLSLLHTWSESRTGELCMNAPFKKLSIPSHIHDNLILYATALVDTGFGITSRNMWVSVFFSPYDVLQVSCVRRYEGLKAKVVKC